MPLTAQHPGTERKFNRDVSVSYNLATTDDYSVTPHTAIAGVANFQIVVQRLLFAVTTASARDQEFRDSTSPTPIPFAAIPGGFTVPPPFTFDFGEDGYVLADGKSLLHTNTGQGVAASITIQAYLRPTPDADIVANVAGTRGFTF